MKWFRFYSEFRSDPKMRRMPIPHRYAFIMLLCLASENNERGTISGLDDDDIAFELEMSTEDWLTLKAKFKAKGLIDFEGDKIQITKWHERQFTSDSSAERVAKHRQKKKKQDCNVDKTVISNVTQTPCNVTETLVEQSVTSPSVSVYVSGSGSEFSNTHTPNSFKPSDPFGQPRRNFNSVKGTHRSCASDPWMASASNPKIEFRDWLVERHKRLGLKACNPADVASEIRGDYARAFDLWQEFQQFCQQQTKQPEEQFVDEDLTDFITQERAKLQQHQESINDEF